MATTPFDTFKQTLGIKPGGSPSLMPQGQMQSQTQIGQQQNPQQVQGQNFLDRLTSRRDSGNNIYNTNKQTTMNRLASTLAGQSSGLKFDEFGNPNKNLTDFGSMGQNTIKGITEHGDLATQIAVNKQNYQNAVTQQSLSGYGMTGTFSVSGTDIPGATSGNVGARAASMALQVEKNGTPYIWGGNSLSTGIDCSGLVQQIYRQLGVNLPRTTYEQAKNGKAIPVNQIRPGDLVFYYGSKSHVGIYIGNGQVVHAANSKLGVITSNLNNSNGAPTLVLRPY